MSLLHSFHWRKCRCIFLLYTCHSLTPWCIFLKGSHCRQGTSKCALQLLPCKSWLVWSDSRISRLKTKSQTLSKVYKPSVIKRNSSSFLPLAPCSQYCMQIHRTLCRYVYSVYCISIVMFYSDTDIWVFRLIGTKGECGGREVSVDKEPDYGCWADRLCGHALVSRWYPVGRAVVASPPHPIWYSRWFPEQLIVLGVFRQTTSVFTVIRRCTFKVQKSKKKKASLRLAHNIEGAILTWN